MVVQPESQRIAQLTPLSEVLGRIDALTRPVSPRESDAGAALGRVLAEDIVVSAGRPTAAIALRDGWAVSSDAIGDASSYTPVLLAAPPARVDVGEGLPATADAVAPLDAVVLRDGRAEAIAPVTPGEGALPAQADAAAGSLLRRAGERLRAVDVAILGALGIARVKIREPRVRLVCAGARGDVADAACALIAGAVGREGAAVIGDPVTGAESHLEAALHHEAADAVIVIGGTGSGRRDASVRTLARVGRVECHGIGLAPGETAAFGLVGTRPVLLLPGRLDGALAVWLVIGRRLLARLAGRGEPDATVSAALTRKISSTVGHGRDGAGAPARRYGGAAGQRISAARPAGAGGRLDPGSGRERRVFGGRQGSGGAAAMNDRPGKPDLRAAIRQAARQEQFLEVISAEDARARFLQHVDLAPLPAETVALSACLGRVLARDITAPIDVPPFDRSGVDGFALRAADIARASDGAPRRLRLNAEVVAAGHAPQIEVTPGLGDRHRHRRHAAARRRRGGDDRAHRADRRHRRPSRCGGRRRRASSSPMRAPTSRAARCCCAKARGSARARSACWRLAALPTSTWCGGRRSRVLSTGDELVSPGGALAPAAVYDSNGAIIAAAIAEAGGEAVVFGAFPDDEAALSGPCAARSHNATWSCSAAARRRAPAICPIASSRGSAAGVLVHGVALKPGKPLCLAVAEGKPVAVLPGFPTSAIFTFHAFIAPVIRARAGLPPEAAQSVEALVPVRIASELGRKEFVLVALVQGDDGLVAFPSAKGSGAVTSFSLADGFLEIEALATRARCRHAGARDPDRQRGAARPISSSWAATISRWRRWSASSPSAASRRAPSRSAVWAASLRRGAANAISRRCT